MQFEDMLNLERSRLALNRARERARLSTNFPPGTDVDAIIRTFSIEGVRPALLPASALRGPTAREVWGD